MDPITDYTVNRLIVIWDNFPVIDCKLKMLSKLSWIWDNLGFIHCKFKYCVCYETGYVC